MQTEKKKQIENEKLQTIQMKGTITGSLVFQAADNYLQPPIQVHVILLLIRNPDTYGKDLYWLCQRHMDGPAVLTKAISRYEILERTNYKSPPTRTDRTLFALLIKL